MHHAAAVREWAKVRDGQDVSLERALAAFDLFVLQDEKEDIDGVSPRLISMTMAYPDHDRSHFVLIQSQSSFVQEKPT
jgi:F-box protein 21